jgi:hypothetical protein
MKIQPFCCNPPNFVLAVLVCFAFSTEAVFGQTDTKGIVLQRNWDSSTDDGDLVVNELRGLLSSVGKAARNLDPAPNLELYHGVTYLMPLKEAVKQLGVLVAVGAKHMVVCPGFPYRTLFVYSYNYPQEEGFNEVHLVADKADQIVAVQLYSGNARKTGIWGLYETPKFNTYDFVNSRAKALTSARVGHRVKSEYDKWFITLESDFRDPTGNVYRYTRLFLPKPLVELILFRIEKIKANSSR